MMRARVISDDKGFDRFDEMLQRRAREAVSQAARAAAEVANSQAGNVGGFRPGRLRGTHEGYAAGIAGKRQAVIFDKGSLGKRRGALKRDRRKSQWPVRRQGGQYVATRAPSTLTDQDKGVAPRNILNPARLAGRRILQTLSRR